jgi:hypothetical protein
MLREIDTENLPTRAAMRPRHGRRVEVREGRRQDRSAYARRTN